MDIAELGIFQSNTKLKQLGQHKLERTILLIKILLGDLLKHQTKN